MKTIGKVLNCDKTTNKARPSTLWQQTNQKGRKWQEGGYFRIFFGGKVQGKIKDLLDIFPWTEP